MKPLPARYRKLPPSRRRASCPDQPSRTPRGRRVRTRRSTPPETCPQNSPLLSTDLSTGQGTANPSGGGSQAELSTGERLHYCFCFGRDSVFLFGSSYREEPPATARAPAALILGGSPPALDAWRGRSRSPPAGGAGGGEAREGAAGRRGGGRAGRTPSGERAARPPREARRGAAAVPPRGGGEAAADAPARGTG